MTKKRYLVTGGCGFIGSNLVDLLLGEGHYVDVIDDLSTGYESNLRRNRARLFIGDIRESDRLDRLAEGVDAIFHLAASVGNARSISDPTRDSEINVLGTINVLESARRNRVPTVVYSSSAGIYGQLKVLPIREDHPCEPDSPYGCSKLCAEKICLAYSRLYPIRTICLRYFNVYGPRQRYDAYGNVIPIFVERMQEGKPLTVYGSGYQTRDFVSVHDVVMANYLAATSDCPSGAYNIGSGEGTSINDLINLLGATDYVHEDPRPGDVLDSVADIAAARIAFGYHPTIDLNNGLHEYLDWYRSTL